MATLPPRLRQAAANALAAVDAAHPDLGGGWRDVAADLAARSGDRARAGRLLRDSGRYSLEVGALATAAGTLRRAADLLEGSPERAGAELMLIEALALAGRVDEAAAAGARLIGRLGDDPATRETRVEAHLRLAQAAVSASRWPMARHHIEAAVRLTAGHTDPNLSARAAVLSAEVALAGDDLDGARRTAEQVLATDGAGPDVRCHALEIVGRSRRLHDLPAAAAAFGAALATAEQASLPVWRLRALHELGTVDMFERIDVGRLLEARRLGEQMGALSTVAVLDLQLSAAFTGRWDLERCDAHAGSALELAGHLRLDQVAAKALAMMAGSASMRADVKATEELAARALAADPADPMLAGFCRASVGMALVHGRRHRRGAAPVRRGHRRPVPAPQRRADIDPGAVAADPGRAGRPPGGGDHRGGPPARRGRLPPQPRPHRLRPGGARGPLGPSRPGRRHRRRACHGVRQLRGLGRPGPFHRRSPVPWPMAGGSRSAG